MCVILKELYCVPSDNKYAGGGFFPWCKSKQKIYIYSVFLWEAQCRAYSCAGSYENQLIQLLLLAVLIQLGGGCNTNNMENERHTANKAFMQGNDGQKKQLTRNPDKGNDSVVGL